MTLYSEMNLREKHPELYYSNNKHDRKIISFSSVWTQKKDENGIPNSVNNLSMYKKHDLIQRSIYSDLQEIFIHTGCNLLRRIKREKIDMMMLAIDGKYKQREKRTKEKKKMCVSNKHTWNKNKTFFSYIYIRICTSIGFMRCSQ